MLDYLGRGMRTSLPATIERAEGYKEPRPQSQGARV